VLVPTRNCWRVARAGRAAFLIDADAYFGALCQSLSRARHSVVILGWDIDSRTRLTRPGPGGAAGQTLLEILNDVLERRPELRVYALAWDFSVIFTLEREPLPTLRFAHAGHPRLSFRLDGSHPLGASQHQKVVVVDDAVAFVGGLDLTVRRWDLPGHRAHEPDRVDPVGQPYPPVHDVQMAVDGQAAAALGELARARWEAATGDTLALVPAPGSDDHDDHHPWPPDLAPDLTDVPVGIARTVGQRDDRPAILEVASLTLDAIAAARRWIYVENQYLTSALVGSALTRSLAQKDGPEVVIVLPREEHGWLEQSSMGILRARLLRRLLDSDRFGRLRIYHPRIPDLRGGCVNVHAKVMVVDASLARVGSANLSNRSMGLDTECDLALDAELEPRLGPGIDAFRDRLLAEHLDVPVSEVTAALAGTGSLIRAIEALAGRSRSLERMPVPAESIPTDSAPPVGLAFLDGLVCDPERPAADLLIRRFVPEELHPPLHRSLAGWASLAIAALVLAAVWRFTPLRQLLHVDRLAALGQSLRAQPLAPLWVLGMYLVGGWVFFPITVLLGATALVFSGPAAIAYCFAGTLLSAASTYGLGRLVGRFRADWLRRPRLERFQRQIRERGTLAIVAARLLPVGNFTLINMAAGAFRVRFGDYMLGNAIGVLPGILALTLFANRLASTLHHPHGTNLVIFAVVALGLTAILTWIRRRLSRHS
jgi:phospholipase D1/2